MYCQISVSPGNDREHHAYWLVGGPCKPVLMCFSDRRFRQVSLGALTPPEWACGVMISSMSYNLFRKPASARDVLALGVLGLGQLGKPRTSCSSK